MTAAQKFKFYFPAWTACVRANGWRKLKGRVVGLPSPPRSGRGIEGEVSNAAPEFAKVVAFATTIALQAGRSLVVDDLRHGCHIVALGRDKSSEQLTDDEMDRVVCLFNVIADPLWLGTDDKFGRLQWDAYLRGENPGAERRVNWIIRSIPEALARKIAMDMIHTRQWEGASFADRKVLARRIAQYKQSQHRPMRSAAMAQTSRSTAADATHTAAVHAENCPF